MISKIRLDKKIYFILLAILCSLMYCSVSIAEDELDKLFGSDNDDPFAQLSVQKPAEQLQPRPVEVSEPVIEEKPEVVVEKKPPMNIENITLEFLEAKNLEPVVLSMLSVYGSVSTDEKSNSLIVCDDVNNLSRIVEQVNKTDKAGHQAIFVETITLKFLDAESLQKAMSSMSSKYGSIAVDVQTNSLIVCDAKENLNRIVSQIRKADRMPEQILIEVVIVDVQLDNDSEIGVNWDNIFKTGDNIGYAQNFLTTTAGGASGGDFKLLMNSMTGTIHALQETKDIEILASPKVLVLSGQEAMIQTIEEIPYRELTDTSDGGSGALSSTEFKEVGVTLRVKATVTENGKIMMKVEPEQSVNTGRFGTSSQQDVPIIDKRSAMTTLMMNDGQVVVMGGLRKSETTISKKQIPLIGNIPYVGILFSDDKKEVNKSELIVMLSPHIYNGEPVTPEEFERFHDLKSRPYLELKEEKRPEIEALSKIVPTYKKNPPQWGRKD